VAWQINLHISGWHLLTKQTIIWCMHAEHKRITRRRNYQLAEDSNAPYVSSASINLLVNNI
jgi:hypothetical protein